PIRDQVGYPARLAAMRKIVLVWLFIFAAATPAAARWFHYHHHHYRHHSDTYSAINPKGQNGYARESAAEPQRNSELRQQSRVPIGQPPTEEQSGQQHNGQYSSSEENKADNLLLPPDWQRQPADPNWQGQRFLSPDGTGSFSAFIAPVAQESTVEHIK